MTIARKQEARHPDRNAGRESGSASPYPECSVALLTGGADRPYVLGLATALMEHGVALDLVGSDELDLEQLRKPLLNFLNLRGDQRPDTSVVAKIRRILTYYFKLILYAANAEPKIFHILWHNKFLAFDRTLLMLYYKILGKTIVFTAHNVNAGKRDSSDTLVNRITLRAQYHLADHTFVHTAKMKDELMEDFGVPANRITIIPFGINNAAPDTGLSRADAKARLGIADCKKNILFFGNITPYKGLEYLITAFQQVAQRRDDFRLLVAGRPTNCESYWNTLRQTINVDVQDGRILVRAEHIPDEDMELYFKAADVLVLPYTHVYQSGVLFTGYRFGIPVLAADVGSLREDIIEGKTGFVFKPKDPTDLALSIESYFRSDLFAALDNRRREIQEYAAKRNSWSIVGQITKDLYLKLLNLALPGSSQPLAMAAHRSADID